MSFIRLKAVSVAQRFANDNLPRLRTDIFDFFEVVVVRPQIYEILSPFVELFGHPSPHSYFFFDCEVLKSLGYERQLSQGHLTYGARGRAEREQSIDARFAPAIYRVLSMRFAGKIEEQRRTFCDSMN